MGKTLTVAQKTFTDLYDSYVLNLSSDIVAVSCDQYGKATEDCEVTITYRANIGTQPVGIKSCDVIANTVPSYTENGVEFKVDCVTTTAGEITITVPKGMALEDDSEIGFIFATANSNSFTFERYVTFVKIKSGEKIVTFQIKSEKGDTFQEGISEIILETVAFDGLIEITSDQASYKWYSYNSANGQWPEIITDQGEGTSQGTTAVDTSYLKVTKTMANASSVIKCVMTYPKDSNNEYEDYFALKVFNHHYEAAAKFFNGRNIIDVAEPFAVSYLELYKDQQLVDTEQLKSNIYFYSANNRRNQDGTLTLEKSAIQSEYKVEDRYMYFIYQDEYDASVTTYTVSAGVEPAGAGSVTGAGSYEINTIPTIYAMSYPGYAFDHWKVNGIDTSNTNSTFAGEPLTSNMSVIAVFTQISSGDDEIPTHFIGVTITPSAGGTVIGGGRYDHGSSATLTATPNDGYAFDDWYVKNEETNTWVKLNWPLTKQIDVVKNWNLMAKFVLEGQENTNYFSALIVASNATNEDVVCLSNDENGIDKTYDTERTSEDGPFYFYAKAGGGRVITGARLEMTFPPVSLPGWPSGGGAIDETYTAAKLREDGLLNDDNTTFVSQAEEVVPTLYGYMARWTIYFDWADNVKTYTVSTQAYPTAGGTVSGGGSGFASGTEVTLIATPNEGYHFEGWTDDAGIISATRVITIGTSDVTYVAIFKEISDTKYTITGVADPLEGGTVYGSGEYTEGSSIKLTAVASTGYKFTRWTDGVLTSERIVSVTDHETYTAKFSEVTADYMLAKISADSANANDRYYVSNSANSTNYSQREAQIYLNQTVYYYAQAGDNSEIASVGINGVTYSADDILSDPSNNWLSSDKKRLVIAMSVSLEAFLGTTYEVIVTFKTVSSGGGTTSDYVLELNENVIMAIPNGIAQGMSSSVGIDNFVLAKFSVPADGTYVFEVTGCSLDEGDKKDTCARLYNESKTSYTYSDDDSGLDGTHFKLTAENLREGEVYYLAVKFYYANHSGRVFVRTSRVQSAETTYYTITVNSSNTNRGTVSGGGSNLASGTTTTIEANPKAGYQFKQWNDGNTENPRTIVVTGNATYTATFIEGDCTITVLAQPPEGGSVTGGGVYKYETNATLVAEANPNYSFKQWSNGYTDSMMSVTVSGDATYTAIFELNSSSDTGYTTDTVVDGVLHIAKGTTATVSHKNETNFSSIVFVDTVTTISDDTFYGCRGLTSVALPNSVTTIGIGAFEACDNLRSVVIPDSVKSIGINAFKGCSALTNLVIGNSVTTIDRGAFNDCDGLVSVTLGGNVTTIGEQAFMYSSNLTSITIPASLTSIGSYAFSGTALTDVYYEGTEAQWNNISIAAGNAFLTNANIHYNSVASYAAAPMMMSAAPAMLLSEMDGIETYAVENNTEKHAKYKAALYQYKNGDWNPVSDNLQYRYKNDLYSNIESNVLVISKNDITNRKDINFTILPKVLNDNGSYVDDNDLIVARANFTVFDLNDPIVSNKEPLNPIPGQIWLDTSQSPYKLYIYQDKDRGWKYFDQQNGRRVYTSRQQLIDEGYSIGDLWVLGKGEQCVIPRENGTGSDTYNEGSMLSSKMARDPYGFNESDWVDAMSGLTTLKNNIDQTFTFDTQRGLKIGQKDNNFYVNISSTKMSFCDNSAGQDKEVVYISNNSANIDNMVVEGSAEFACNVQLGAQLEFGVNNGSSFTSKFALQLENNGSLSLVVAT